MKRFAVCALIFLIAIVIAIIDFGHVRPGFAQTAEDCPYWISGASGSVSCEDPAIPMWGWTAPATGLVTFDTQGSDMSLTLWVDTPDPVYREVATAENEVRFTAQQGAEYIVLAQSLTGQTGTIVLNWQISSASGGDPSPEPDMHPTSPPEHGAASHGLGTVLSYVVAGTTAVLAEIEYVDYVMHNGRWVLVVFNDAAQPETSACHGMTHEYLDLETGNWVACLRNGELLGELTPHNGFFRFPMKLGDRWTQTMSWTDHVNPSRSSIAPFSHTYEVEACGIEVEVPAGRFTTCRVRFVEASYSNIVDETRWYDPDLNLVVRTDWDDVVYELWDYALKDGDGNGGTLASGGDPSPEPDMHIVSPPEHGAASHGLGTVLSYVVAGTTDVLSEMEYVDYVMHNGRWVLVVFSDAAQPETSACHGMTHEYLDLETGNWVACLRNGELLGELTPHIGFFRFPMRVGDKWTQTMSWTNHVNPARSSIAPFSHTYVVEACGIKVEVPAGRFTTCRVKFVEASFPDIASRTHWYDPDLNLAIRTDWDGVVYELWDYALKDGNGDGGVLGHDDFGSSTAISGVSGRSERSNVGASKESGEPDHAGKSGGASVWWTWKAPAAGEVTFDTRGSGFDTLLAVYTGDSVSRLTEVASNDDVEVGRRQSEVRFTAQQGETYHVAVDSFGSKRGAIVLNWQAASTFIVSAETSISGPDGLTAIGRDITWLAPPPETAELDRGWNYVRNGDGDLHGLQIHVDGTEIVAEQWLNGVRQTRASYRDGEPHGEFAGFADGKLDGVQYWIDEDNWSFETFRDGTPHGPFGSYLDGEPEGEFGAYFDGQLDGIVHTIDQAGDQAGWHFETWRDGTRHGPYGSYDRNGRKHGFFGTFTDDSKDKGETLHVRGAPGQGGNGNRPPAAVRTIRDITLTRGVSTSLFLASYFTDPDDAPLTTNLFFSAQSDDTSVARVRCGSSNCTIRPVFGGTTTITVTATDSGGLTAVQEFEVTVPANRPPIPLTYNVPEEITFSRKATESLYVTSVFKSFFADPDGDTLLYNYETEPPGWLTNHLPFRPDGLGGDWSGRTGLNVFAARGTFDPRDNTAVATVTACDRGPLRRGVNHAPHPERLCKSVNFRMIVQSDFTNTSPGDLSVEAPYCTHPLVNTIYPITEMEICARDLDYVDGDGLALRLSGDGVLGYDDYPYNCSTGACLDFDFLTNSMSCKTIKVQGSIVEVDYKLRPLSQRGGGWWGWDTSRPLCQAGQSPDCFVGPELFGHPGEDVNRGELTIRTRSDSDTGEWRSKTSHITHSALKGEIRIVAVESNSSEHCGEQGQDTTMEPETTQPTLYTGDTGDDGQPFVDWGAWSEQPFAICLMSDDHPSLEFLNLRWSDDPAQRPDDQDRFSPETMCCYEAQSRLDGVAFGPLTQCVSPIHFDDRGCEGLGWDSYEGICPVEFKTITKVVQSRDYIWTKPRRCEDVLGFDGLPLEEVLEQPIREIRRPYTTGATTCK